MIVLAEGADSDGYFATIKHRQATRKRCTVQYSRLDRCCYTTTTSSVSTDTLIKPGSPTANARVLTSTSPPHVDIDASSVHTACAPNFQRVRVRSRTAYITQILRPARSGGLIQQVLHFSCSYEHACCTDLGRQTSRPKSIPKVTQHSSVIWIVQLNPRPVNHICRIY